MNVELIYDADCPNVAAARTALHDAFATASIPARWQEWVRGAPGSPIYTSAFGSPTILVDGRDVAGASPDAGAASCRVYRSDDGSLSGTPPVEQLCAALLKTGQARGRLRPVTASLPAVGTALLPKLTCPLCWPAYTAVLSALGLEFVDYTPYLFPATLAFLALAVGMLALAARRTGRWTPLLIGLASAVIVLTGKFAMDSDWVANSGIALLVAAVFLSTRMRAVRPPPCQTCVETEAAVH